MGDTPVATMATNTRTLAPTMIWVRRKGWLIRTDREVAPFQRKERSRLYSQRNRGKEEEH